MSIEKHRNKFKKFAIDKDKEKYKIAIQRVAPLEPKPDDIRTDFARDYTRILHSMGYRRLKHKTQVFFAPENDHICTRIEHVSHVESASCTIAGFLGLNTELVKAIAISHDIGHAPFGHLGETILKEIVKKENMKPFWHEQNGVHFVDNVEYLYDSNNNYTNLNLTYAVRDGIISHCGEVNQNGLKPRKEAIDLIEYKDANQYAPYTWEGCVVKLADKISYLGRDIEDATRLKIIKVLDYRSLIKQANSVFNLKDVHVLNTTSLMNLFITDLCKNSDKDNGLCFSEPVFKLMKATMAFNYEKIYKHPRLIEYRNFADVILNTIFKILMTGYNGLDTPQNLSKKRKEYNSLFTDFIPWIMLRWDLPIEIYWDKEKEKEIQNKNKMKKAYCLCYGESEYKKAVIDYISGMTDNYAKRMFEDICAFK